MYPDVIIYSDRDSLAALQESYFLTTKIKKTKSIMNIYTY